jgi:hypothetical protein
MVNQKINQLDLRGFTPHAGILQYIHNILFCQLAVADWHNNFGGDPQSMLRHHI